MSPGGAQGMIIHTRAWDGLDRRGEQRGAPSWGGNSEGQAEHNAPAGHHCPQGQGHPSQVLGSRRQGQSPGAALLQLWDTWWRQAEGNAGDRQALLVPGTPGTAVSSTPFLPPHTAGGTEEAPTSPSCLRTRERDAFLGPARVSS